MVVTVRRVVVPVLASLQTYWRTALLLALSAGLGLALLITISAFAGSDGWGGGTRLHLVPPFGALTGLPWSTDVLSVAVTRQAAVDQLFILLLLGAGGALAVIGLTILTFSAAREGEREVDIAVRRAVGASRRLLLVSALLECAALLLLVVVLGGSAGTMLSAGAAQAWPGLLSPGVLAPSLQALVAIAGGIVFGALVPVLFSRRRRVVEGVGRPLPLVIPAVQLGLSLAVLTAGTLVARYALNHPSGGMVPSADDVVYQVNSRQPSASIRAAQYARLLDRLAAEPRALASLSNPGALMGLGPVDVITTDCGDCREGNLRLKFHEFFSTHLIVSADTFKALQVKLVAGRLLTDADRMGTEKVVVINRAMAFKHFQYGQPLGRQLKVADDLDQWYTVVGVVEDPPRRGLGVALQPVFTAYLSVLQQAPASVELLTRPEGRVAVQRALAATFGAAAAAADPVRVADLVAAEDAPVAWVADRFGTLGWGMLVLASGALLALMRLWVASLRTELGLRMAVGASRLRLMALVLGRTTAVGAAGIAVGLWFGPALWGGIRDLLPQLPGWDPAILSGYALILMLAALAGAVGPAWHAIRMAPAQLIESGGA